MIRGVLCVATALTLLVACDPRRSGQSHVSDGPARLQLVQDEDTGTLAIFRIGEEQPIVTQHARIDFRPYIHPIIAPDGKGILTEYSPGHHQHQTGLYWGFTRVNGRDYFHHPGGDYWRRAAVEVMQDTGAVVKWQTVYDLLDEDGNPVLRETQRWSMRTDGPRYFLDLEWKGEARTDVTIGQYDYGGLFLRMPWKEGIKGEVINAARQRNDKAEGQHALWVDVGMEVDGRDDLAHIAIFDHPDNKGYPQAWRVDEQLGVGPVPTRAGDWAIASGQAEIIRHQIVIYTGDFHDVELTKTWSAYTGTASTHALWEVAREEGRTARFLTPSEAVTSMTLLPGYRANVWASEPMMTQPMAFCWDDRGRLWIAENRDYESRGRGFSNAGDSRILILEDTDRDGIADKRTVFLEGIAFPAALAVGFGGVYVGAPPNLLFIPDRDSDDVADEDDIEVLLTGWGIQDRHETLNSLHWGPDGWLYGLQGFATPSKVRKPVGKGRIYRHNDPFPDDILKGEGVDINGGVWRYHPTKDRFEVVAHGFSNPWGIDYDAKGQLFISACVIPHLWHVIPGGIYHRQGGRHYNPYIYRDIRTITDHSHRSAHGGARIYQSDAFPTSQHGRLFMANIHEHAVLSDVLERRGSGFTGRHGDDFMLANNAQWVGFSMEVGPDGGLYVLDWHDADICGQEVLNEETGRIFRIMPEQSLAKEWEGRYHDLRTLSDLQLAELQTSASDWHARRARVILQERAAKKISSEAETHLKKLYTGDKNTDWRLRALWTLHITGNVTTEDLAKALDSKEEYIRAWAIQLLCEDKTPPDGALRKFAQMARDDASPVVRLYLAAAMQRIGATPAWQIGEALAMRAEDAADHNLPAMIWFGLEPLVARDPARGLALAAESRIPVLAEYTARRTVDADAMEHLLAALAKKPPTLVDMLRGMRDALEGRRDLTAPSQWNTLYSTLRDAGGQTAALAAEISQTYGDTEVANAALATLTDARNTGEARKKALNLLAAHQRPELLRELSSLIDDPAVRIEAIRAIAAYDNDELGKKILAEYQALDVDEKREALLTLSSRPRYGRMLAQAIKEQTILRADVPVYVARQLRRVVGSGFVEIWGPIDDLPAEQNAAYNKYQRLLTTNTLRTADLARGKMLFQHTCGSCHKMFGEGAAIGPDLTGSNRTNTNYILANVLNPSEEIQDDYRMVVITTRDGRTYSGNITVETDRQVTMRIVGRDAVIINKSDIQSRETTDVSMMPPGLFDSLNDDEVIDLVAYLRITDPIAHQ